MLVTRVTVFSTKILITRQRQREYQNVKRFGVVVWMVENDVKTLVRTRSNCCVLGQIKTEVLENALVCTGPPP